MFWSETQSATLWCYDKCHTTLCKASELLKVLIMWLANPLHQLLESTLLKFLLCQSLWRKPRCLLNRRSSSKMHGRKWLWVIGRNPQSCLKLVIDATSPMPRTRVTNSIRLAQKRPVCELMWRARRVIMLLYMRSKNLRLILSLAR